MGFRVWVLGVGVWGGEMERGRERERERGSEREMERVSGSPPEELPGPYRPLAHLDLDVASPLHGRHLAHRERE